MTREIRTHVVNEANDKLKIEVTDTEGAGGAQHRYVISGYDANTNYSKFTVDEVADKVVVLFQQGPINEVGVNGVTHEALLAIVIDRLQSFQRGPYACRENALALTKLEEGVMWLQSRTRARMARGVEGTMAK